MGKYERRVREILESYVAGYVDRDQLLSLIREADMEIRALIETDPVSLREQRRVVCAAIRAADGDLVLGIRHYSADMHLQIDARKDGHKFVGRLDSDHGFVDQHGRWMTREQAYHVAVIARQLRFPDACGFGLDGPKLYSEALY